MEQQPASKKANGAPASRLILKHSPLARAGCINPSQGNMPMKLNSALVERTLNQFEAQAIPENHPVVPQLNSLFGDHTFFLNNEGLSIVEPTDTAEAGAQTGQVINIANWNDDARTSLVPHEPEPTDVVVVLAPMTDGAG
jgi:hypothetical protein